MTNKYLEKIASVIEISPDGFVHTLGSDHEYRAKVAKNITPTNWKKIGKKSKRIAAVGAVAIGGSYVAKQLYNKAMQKKAADESSDKQLRDTAIIGATGTATGIAASKISDSMGLNGPRAPKIAGGPSILERASAGLKNPSKVIGSVLKNPGFRRTAKIGAISGALGLAGDYGAVKLMNHLDKPKN